MTLEMYSNGVPYSLKYTCQDVRSLISNLVTN